MPESFAAAKLEAKRMGRDYSDWDDEQLSQSAEMANVLAPEIRRLAGYKDPGGMGTYTSGGEEEGWNEEELWEIFWDSFHDQPHVPVEHTVERSPKKGGVGPIHVRSHPRRGTRGVREHTRRR